MKKAMYEDVKLEYERIYKEKDSSFYEDSQEIRANERRNMWNLFESQNRGYADRDVGQTGSEGLQVDSERNDEHLRTGDNRKSLKLYPDAKKILDSNPELKQVFEYLQSQFKLVPNHRTVP